MKILLPLIGIIALGACTAPIRATPEIKAAVAKMPEKELPSVDWGTVHQACFYKKPYTPTQQRACKVKLQREKAERQLMRKQAEENISGKIEE